MDNLGLEVLTKALEVNQPYKIAIEQAEAMNPFRNWGEPYEALVNQHHTKVEKTTEIIESILNLADLIDDELFDDILLTASYDDIKSFIFKLIGEGKLKQDVDGGKMVLIKVET